MSETRFSFEECPLQSHVQCVKKPKSFKGPERVVRLCLLGIILPTILLATPLYLRYKVFCDQIYPVSMSDMRLLDTKISTTWCQKQIIKLNTTFNAFLLPEAPRISENYQNLSMLRHLVLEDDTKEYWGFYLIKGSSVTVSSCSRWPGASLIVIRGHKHLHECAYIGDNSSEELDEIMESLKEGTYIETPDQRKVSTFDKNTKKQESAESSDQDAPTNDPDLMKRYSKYIKFHHPHHENNRRLAVKDEASEGVLESETDPKALKKLLESLQTKSHKSKSMIVPEEVSNNIVDINNSTVDINNATKVENSTNKPVINGTSSEEIYSDILDRLEKMGARGTVVLEKLTKKLNNQIEKKGAANIEANDEKIAPLKNRVEEDQFERANRKKRDLVLATAAQDFNKDDDENDQAVEEDLQPDGIADHRGRINETTPNDKSNSEFWSSFSSSEEALLNCAGLILNLPLTPHHQCRSNLTEKNADETYLPNTITYKVPVNGYYFFVFNSENEVQPNYIRVHFKLQKAVYDVSKPVAECANSNTSCSLNLKFFSSERTVLELPVPVKANLLLREFVVVSQCEPRTALYVICVIAVPVLVVIFAFS